MMKVKLIGEIISKNIFVTKQLTSDNSKFPFFIKYIGTSTDVNLDANKFLGLNDYIIFYQLSGNTQCFIKRQVEYLKENDLLICSGNVIPLKFSAIRKNDSVCCYVIFSGENANFYYNMIREKRSIFTINQLSNIQDCFYEILTCGKENTLENLMKNNLSLTTILTELFCISSDIKRSREMIPQSESSIKISLQYIEKNYKNEISLDELCQQSFISKFYFCKLFLKTTGYTPHEYINRYRVNQAKNLLTFSKMTFTAISKEVGFMNKLSLDRNFLKYTGMTPREYRSNF